MTARAIFAPFLFAAAFFLACLQSPALADLGDCSQPVTSGAGPSASDCLFILRVAVGSEICEVECICAPKGSTPTTASDALVCLRVAVGQPVEIDCPCGSDTPIQDIQDGTVETGEVVTLENVFVTGLVVSVQGHRTFVLQEPAGSTPPAHDYPEFAGMRGFASSQTVASLPDLAAAEVGDCVSITGVVAEFQGATQLSNVSAFELKDAGACGSLPTPLEVSLAVIATDTDPLAAGDQAGPQAETYEGVLLRVSSVEVVSIEPSGDLRVAATGGSGPTLVVSSLLFDFAPVEAGTTFTSITGVLTEAQVSAGVTNYRLAPRSQSDFVE